MAGPLHDTLGEAFFPQVPSKPGVYLMLGEGGELLYVGKAKNLRTRLRSYARLTAGDDERLLLLVSAVRAVTWEEYPTDDLALGRETELLRAMRPPFNFTHTSSSEYLAIAVAGRGQHIRLRLTAGDAPSGETRYGCFPFAAATPDAYKALLRALYLAQPNAGPRIPSRLTRASGCDMVLAPEVRAPLRAYLAGRSTRLLTVLEAAIAGQHGGDTLVLRSAARDLEVLRPFYHLGPRALRRLQQRQGAPFGGVTGDELTRLLAAEMADQTGVRVETDRTRVEARIAALRHAKLGFRAIADRLNDESTPRLRGGGRWRADDVAEVVGAQIARATTNLRQ
jgi:hypothetical protein